MIEKLRQYPFDLEKRDKLKEDIARLKTDKKRYLSGERPAKKESVRVQTGSISKPVQAIVENIESLELRISLLSVELKEVKRNIQDIDKRMKVLRPVERKIIKARYMCKGKPEEYWKLAQRLYYSPDWIRHACMRAISKLCAEKTTQKRLKKKTQNSAK